MWEPQGVYSKFALKQPHILFGQDAIMGLKTYPSTRAVVVYGSSCSKDYLDIVERALTSFQVLFIKKSWSGEPALENLSDTIQQVERAKPDLILAIGGGSVIDGVKMVRTYYEFPFFDVNNSKFSMLNWKTTFVAIPTTIGSGAEISSASVIYNGLSKSKEFVVSHQFIPEIIILESELIQSAPASLLLKSMVDALSHCIEGYMSTVDNTIMDVYAEKAIQIFVENYQSLLKENPSGEVLNQLQLASVFAGMVQNHCIVGATHALAHQMSSYGLSHSGAISLFLVEVIKRNIKDKASKIRFESLAVKSGFNSSDDFLNFIDTFINSLDLSKEKAVLHDNIDEILTNGSFIQNALNDKGGQGNPVPLTEKVLTDILKSVVK